MPELANLVNSDLARDFTVSQVAEKHNWTEPMAWSLALEGRKDIERLKLPAASYGECARFCGSKNLAGD